MEDNNGKKLSLQKKCGGIQISSRRQMRKIRRYRSAMKLISDDHEEENLLNEVFSIKFLNENVSMKLICYD